MATTITHKDTDMLDSYTTDGCLDGKTRKRQSAIDIIRLASAMADELRDRGELTTNDETCISNCINEFLATLPKADREELRHG